MFPYGQKKIAAFSTSAKSIVPMIVKMTRVMYRVYYYVIMCLLLSSNTRKCQFEIDRGISNFKWDK